LFDCSSTGGVFEHDYERELSIELRRVVDAINGRPALLPPDVHLVFDVEYFPAHDSFAATRIGKSQSSNKTLKT
jgi:hypothetical protein